MWAIDPLVIQRLTPLRIQPSPSGVAFVSIPLGSEPWSGSERPKQPISSPLAIFRRYFCFCSSVPKVWIGYMHSEPCTEQKERRPESPRSSSCIMRP